MHRQYEQEYRQKSISHQKLSRAILDLYSNYDPYKQYNYDQMLFILDAKCKGQKCDRDVAKQLFDQAANADGNATLRDLVFKYVENLQTSKICLIRDEFKKAELLKSNQKLKSRSKTYVFLKMIQASVYSRFSRSPSFEYKISPSNIPPITLINTLNPVLNHEYTLQLQTKEFNIIFYESGIEIFKWTFPDNPNIKEGQYQKSINTENVSFQVQIKYLPKNQNLEKDNLQEQAHQQNAKINIEREAFTKLCSFQPFLQKDRREEHLENNSKSSWWNFTEKLALCLPFLSKHVRNLHIILIILLLLQCLACNTWSMEFLDVAIIVYTIGLLYDREIINFGIRLTIIQLIFFLLIVKSVWGTVIDPFNNRFGRSAEIIVVCIVFKFLAILFLGFSSIRRQQIPMQRQTDLYGTDLKKEEQPQHELQKNIYQSGIQGY